MLQFETFIARHGEVAAQAVLENLERYEGIRSSYVAVPLEERWQRLMKAQAQDYQQLAA